MSRFTRYLFAATLLLTFRLALAQSPTNSLSGRWTVTVDINGTPLDWRMELVQQGGKVSGDFAGDKFEGTVSGKNIHFLAKDEHGGTSEVTATIAQEPKRPITLNGTVIFTDPDDKEHPNTHAITG